MTYGQCCKYPSAIMSNKLILGDNQSLPVWNSSNNQTQSSLEIAWQHRIIPIMAAYIIPIYLSVGTVGNITAIIVFHRPGMSAITNGGFFVIVALMDLGILYACLLTDYLIIMQYIHPFSLQGILISDWIKSSMGMLDPWLLVTITAERAVAVFRPLNTWTNKKDVKHCHGCPCGWRFWNFSGVIFIVLFTMCFLFNLPIVFQINLRKGIYISFFKAWLSLQSLLILVVPYMIMLGLDTGILYKLHGSPFAKLNTAKTKASRKWWKSVRNVKFGGSIDSEIHRGDDETSRSSDTSRSDHSQSRISAGRKSIRSRALQSIRLILVMDALSIALNLPMTIVSFLWITDFVAFSICRFVLFARHAFGFLFYLTSGQFREELTVMFCKRANFDRRTNAVSNSPLETIASSVMWLLTRSHKYWLYHNAYN